MRIWQSAFLKANLVPVCALWTVLCSGTFSVCLAQDHAKPHVGKALTDTVPEVQEVVDAMTGTVPAGEESHAVDYGKPPLQPELPLFLFTLILFSGFVLVMRKSVWIPLIDALNSREERVGKAETDARAARIEVDQLTARAESRLAEVYSEVKTIVAKARAEAEARKLEIVTQAEAEAQRIKQQALSDISQARTAALAEIEATIDQQVALATEHVAGRRL